MMRRKEERKNIKVILDKGNEELRRRRTGKSWGGRTGILCFVAGRVKTCDK